VLAAGLALGGCYNVPVTGRNAVSMVDDKDVTEKAKAEFEKAKSMQKISRNPAHIRVVNNIGARISQVAFWDVPLAEWEFVVFEAPGVLNAFAMPGGKVAVFSGLITFCENEDQLASVIAHEIAHVSARHTNERLSQQMAIRPVGAVASAVNTTAVLSTGGSNPIYAPVSVRGLVGGGPGLGTAVQNSWDQGKELEADHIGLIYMARAGYNPREAMKLLQRMEQHEAASGAPSLPAWLSNHPDFPERQVQLLDLMPEAVEIYESRGEQGGVTIIE